MNAFYMQNADSIKRYLATARGRKKQKTKLSEEYKKAENQNQIETPDMNARSSLSARPRNVWTRSYTGQCSHSPVQPALLL